MLCVKREICVFSVSTGALRGFAAFECVLTVLASWMPAACDLSALREYL